MLEDFDCPNTTGSNNYAGDGSTEWRRSITTIIFTKNELVPKDNFLENGKEAIRPGEAHRNSPPNTHDSTSGGPASLEDLSESEEQGMNATESDHGSWSTPDRRCINRNSLLECALESKCSDNIDEATTIPRQRLQRGLAVCEDDDTKLRPPPRAFVQMSSSTLSKSFSRGSESSDYTDRCGTDLTQFIIATLHKSQVDRNQLLYFEEKLNQLVLDDGKHSLIFDDLKSSYDRMLLHRCAALYGMDHNVRNNKQEVVVNKSDRTQIPESNFRTLITHDNFTDSTKAQTQEQRPPMQHIDSFSGFTEDSGNGTKSPLLRRTQSTEVYYSRPAYSLRYEPVVPTVPFPAAFQQHPVEFVHSRPHAPFLQSCQGCPNLQRSFEVGSSHQSGYYQPRGTPIKKADSFGGIARMELRTPQQDNGCYYPNNYCHSPQQVTIINSHRPYGSASHLMPTEPLNDLCNSVQSTLDFGTQKHQPYEDSTNYCYFVPTYHQLYVNPVTKMMSSPATMVSPAVYSPVNYAQGPYLVPYNQNVHTFNNIPSSQNMDHPLPCSVPQPTPSTQTGYQLPTQFIGPSNVCVPTPTIRPDNKLVSQSFTSTSMDSGYASMQQQESLRDDATDCGPLNPHQVPA